MSPSCRVCTQLPPNVRRELKESTAAWVVYRTRRGIRLAMRAHVGAPSGHQRRAALGALKAAVVRRRGPRAYYYFRKARGPHWWVEACWV